MAKDLADSIGMEVRSAGPCLKEYDFTISQQAMERETQNAVREFSQLVNLPGFRPGKAPVGMVKSRFAKEIEEELTRRVFRTAYQKIMTDKELDVVGCSPEGEPAVKPDTECKFTLKVELAPEFELGDYKSLKVEVPKTEITDEQLNERVGFYRKMYGDFADVNEPAQAEDMLKVSYSSDFELPEGASATLTRQVRSEDNFLWLSQPEMIPGSIAALTGAEVGKEYSFAAAYPEDYRESALAGKTVNYQVKVLAVRRRGELNDEQLCAKTQSKDLESFKATLRQSLEQEAEARRNEELTRLVYEKLSASIPEFELPPGILEAEVSKELRKLANETVKSAEDAKKFEAELETRKAEATTRARENLRKTFILRKIAKAENITVTPEEFDAQLKGMSYYYGYKEKELRSMLEKTGGMDELQLDMLNHKVLAFLVKQSA